MIKKIISSILFCSMVAVTAAPLAALADGDSSSVIYEMNSVNEVRLGDGKNDMSNRYSELVNGVYGRDVKDTSIKVSMDTTTGSRPTLGNNK